MGGCFGNHAVDRWMESQLFNYLEEDAEYEHWCEKIDDLYPDEMLDKYADDIYDDLGDKLYNYLYLKDYSAEDASRILIRYFNNQDEKQTELQ
jgi:hypothetical protein